MDEAAVAAGQFVRLVSGLNPACPAIIIDFVPLVLHQPRVYRNLLIDVYDMRKRRRRMSDTLWSGACSVCGWECPRQAADGVYIKGRDMIAIMTAHLIEHVATSLARGEG